MSNNDWTNKLRDQLADYQEPVGDDLWAGIEQSLAQKGIISEKPGMPSETPTSKVSAKTVFLRRFSMAAAIAALAVGGTYVYHLVKSDNASQMVATLPAPQGKFKPVVDGIPSNLPSAQLTKASSDLLATASSTSSSLSTLHLMRQVSLMDKKTGENLERNDDAIAQVLEKKEDKVEEAKEQEELLVVHKRQEPLMASASGYTTKESYHLPRRHQTSGVSVNLYGENGLLAMNSSSASPLLASSGMDDPVFMAQPPKMDDYMVENALFASYKEAAYQEEIKHHQPISIGVQVGIGLAPRLRLTTGLVYTTTSSDFIGKVRGTVTTSTKQDLSYVGIPVSLSYDVWSMSRLHTYVTVGGEGAVNVKNHTETDGQEIDAKRDRMQWSSQAAVGVQYDILPQVGVYVEPGAKYYFDNGSQIENVFKEKKLNFNFQFGLRWNLGK